MSFNILNHRLGYHPLVERSVKDKVIGFYPQSFEQKKPIQKWIQTRKVEPMSKKDEDVDEDMKPQRKERKNWKRKVSEHTTHSSSLSDEEESDSDGDIDMIRQKQILKHLPTIWDNRKKKKLF